MKQTSRNTRNRSRRPHPKRRGSTLMIVMVLMGMLSLLGVIFYTFAAQERSNAEYYSNAAKNDEEPSLDADVLFDWALEQIIVGTDPRLKNSMLWGSRYSLLSNALGVGYHKPGDLHPFNGEGVNVIFDSASGQMGVDQNRDGTIEPGNSYLLDWVDSVAATKNSEPILTERQLVGGSLYFPQPDVGYTYPDINNPFLCYVGKVRDQNGQVHQVVKPSYMVPGLLRNPITGAPNTTWYSDNTVSARSMRAHQNHKYVFPTQSSTVVSRYLTDAEALAKIGTGAYGFPFVPMASNYDTTSGTGAQFTQGRMGPFTKTSVTPTAAAPNGDDPVEFDYDNDGDGIPESILMDLDFPPQQDSSGKMFVPLFLVTIHDLDALINLTVHGNIAKVEYGDSDMSIAGTAVNNSVSPFGTDTVAGNFFYISQSNLGIGPAEVNPGWALNARYSVDNSSGSVFAQHQKFFGALPTLLTGAYPPWAETANMELLWTKIGRPQFSSGGTMQDLYPGVYGEENLLYSAYTGGTYSAKGGKTLPRPGVSRADDNNNANEGQGIAPFYQHPIDFTGQGSYQQLLSPKQITWITSGANRWISYTKYNSNASSLSPSSSNILWGQHADAITNQGDLMVQNLTQGNYDDPYEIAYYNTDKRAVDNLFDPDEMLYLRLNNSEINRLNVTSRLAKLLPFNFAKTAGDNARGQEIRRKFTTISNDRKNFGLPYMSASAVPSGRYWEYSIDTAPLGGNLGPYVRQQNTNTLRFPPEFGTGGASPVRRYTTILSTSTVPYVEDPFRPFTRGLLEMDNDPIRSQHSLQRKLSVNQLFTYNNATGSYVFRPLTMHPDDPGTTPISTTYPPPLPNVPYPPTNSASQEYWARRDRQQMARDIYVLLYLLGHGDDSKNTATISNSGNTLYSDVQLREMAQFAVNLVDAMDRDSVMTRFEYDKDLSDGWNLDDDPFGPTEYTAYGTGDPNYNAAFPNDSAARGEVFGVERLDLSISEVLAIRTEAINPPGQHPGTAFDDGTQHVFGYVELHNQSPFPVTFTDNEAWQVVIRQNASGMTPTWERRLSLKSGAGNVPAGQRYTIGSADGDVGSATAPPQTKSLFILDPNWSSGNVTASDSNMWMAPYQKPIVNNGAGIYGLDLLSVTTPSSAFRIEDASGNDKTAITGAFMNAFSGPAASLTEGNLTSQVQFVLRRRAHPTRSRLTYTDTNDNPWVDVDIMTLPKIGSFSLSTTSDNAAAIQGQLKNLYSYERPQPFAQDQAAQYNVPPANYPTNSLSASNKNGVSPFTVWQPHFDRDFTSVMDLLLLPVGGPNVLTQRQRGAMWDSPEGQLTDVLGGGTGYQGAKSAAAKFLVPEDPTNWSAVSNRSLDNRWHRLLEFIEVPTRTNQNLGVGSDLTIPRVPGKMNINMFRNAESLAAVLDDSNFLTLKIDGTDLTGMAYHPVDAEAGELYDNFEPATRDWWDQFVKSRDKVDPYWQSAVGVNLPLPGLPGSRPFRSLADVGYSTIGGKHASVDDTILRTLPADGTGPLASGQSRRRLLEVGMAGEHPISSGTTGLSIDPLIRNKLLAKFANNTTTRSNTFAIFISVKYFSAVADNANGGAIRIGGPYNGKQEPEHRGFFVVDRSKLEQGQYSGVPNYDFRTFVEYRKTLATQ